MVKQRVETSVYKELETSIPDGVRDRRTLIDANDENFNALAEIRIRETTLSEGRQAVATQFCTGASVEIDGYTTTEPGLLFLMAAHCDTEAPLGGFHVDLDFSYVDASGQSQTLHLETKNPEHVWNSTTYGGYTSAGDEHGDNDLSLVFIPTTKNLPSEIQPLVFNPAQNNALINQYGGSLMIPTAGADSRNMRVDQGASLKQNHGPGESAEMDAHVSVSTSGAPVIPHENGEPIRDDLGRIITIGPIASIATGTGIALFANPDPEIFAEAPFLTASNGPAPILSANADILETTPRHFAEPEIAAASQSEFEITTFEALTVAPIAQETVIPETEYQSFASSLDTGTYGSQNFTTSDQPESLLLQKIIDIDPIVRPETDVFFNINLTDQGYVISDASEFMQPQGQEEFASRPQREGALITIKF